MAITVKGSLVFGLTDPTIAGISNPTSVQSTRENSVNTPARDVGGETVCRVYGDPKDSVRVEGYNSAATLPALGTAATVGDLSGVVMRAGIQAANQDFVKVNVDIEGFAGVDYS